MYHNHVARIRTLTFYQPRNHSFRAAFALFNLEGDTIVTLVSLFVAGRVVLNHTRVPLLLLPSGRVVDDVAEVAVPVPKMASLFRAVP